MATRKRAPRQQNIGGRYNGVAVFKVLTNTPHVEPYEKTIACNITHNRIFIFARAFCRNTFRQLDGIEGQTPYELLSYSVET